jgi:polynucleotide 5'-kinase involved in rRNA processing
LATAVPDAHSANPIPSDKPKTRKESPARPRKEKNHRKRRSRRKRRAEKYRESLKDSEIQELAANDRHIEEDATTKKFDRKNSGDLKVEKDVTILDDPFWTLDF